MRVRRGPATVTGSVRATPNERRDARIARTDPVTVAGPRRTHTGFLRGVAARGLPPSDRGTPPSSEAPGVTMPTRACVTVGAPSVVSGPCPPPVRASRPCRSTPAPARCGCMPRPTGRWPASGCPAAGSPAPSWPRAWRLAEQWGDGHIELTCRRTSSSARCTRRPAGALAGRLSAAGLLPSTTHELVRNIAAPPLPAARPRDPGRRSTGRCAPTRRWPPCPAASCSPSTTAPATWPTPPTWPRCRPARSRPVRRRRRRPARARGRGARAAGRRPRVPRARRRGCEAGRRRRGGVR